MEQKIINLDDSDNSDIEVLQVNCNVSAGTKKFYRRNLQNCRKTKVYVNTVNCSDKKKQDSYIKEEIIISDGDDTSDIDCKNENIIKTEKNDGLNNTFKSFPNARQKTINKNDSFSSIILNCPRCNKTEKVFCTTITSICKECKINMQNICDKCNNRYESLPALFRHKKLQCQSTEVLTPKKLFRRKCTKCSHSESIQHLKLFKKCPSCTLHMTFECIICSKTYNTFHSLHLHSKLQCQPKNHSYYCNECNFKTMTQKKLIMHLNSRHGQYSLFKGCCIKCNKEYTNKISLHQHESICVKPRQNCKFCKYRPRYLSNYRIHLLKVHSGSVRLDEVDAIVRESAEVSEEFNKTMETMNKTQNERFSVRDVKTAYCPNCRKQKLHKRGNNKCLDCGTNLVYECNSCAMRFRSTQLLYRHTLRKHHQSSYNCGRCARKFAFYGDANEHMKFCGLEPQYECNICFFKTRYKHNLQKHVEKLHGEKRESICTGCGFIFKTEGTLNRHLQMGCLRKR